MSVITLIKLGFPFVTLALCAAAPAFAVPVSVSVVGPDNKPLESAKLNVTQGGIFDNRMTDARPQAGAGGVFAWDWDGEFKVPAAADAPFERLHALMDAEGAKKVGSYLRVKASAPGMVSESRLIKAGQTTIMLQPARAWSGLVLDQNQKPVVGATLKLEPMLPMGANKSSSFYERYLDPMLFVDDLLATTDATGRWTFLGLPALGNAEISVEAPPFVPEKFSLSVGEGDAAPIVLKQAAQITGVLRAPDGKPIVGRIVIPASGRVNQVITDAQGRFTIKGVVPGDTTLRFDKPKAGVNEVVAPDDFILPLMDSFRVAPGQTTDVGEIRAQTGLVLTARVVSADTKLPLDKANFVGVLRKSETSFDTKGQLQVRFLGPDPDGGFGLSFIQSEGYVNYPLSRVAFVAAKGLIDLGTIEMKRGSAVVGTARIEGGTAASRLPIIYLKRDKTNEFLRPDATGAFKTGLLEAGTYQVIAVGSLNWKIVSPLEVAVPAASEAAAPLEIVIKRLTSLAPLVSELRGQLSDAQGQPIAGAVVTARFQRDGLFGRLDDTSATSDAQGNFAVVSGSGDTIGVEWGGATHPSMLVFGAPKIEVRDGIATVSGLTAKKRGAIFAGRVVGADGQGADKTWVAVLGAPGLAPIQTDAAGKFELLDVPLDKFTLIAAQGREWTQLATQSDKSGATLPPLAPSAAPDLDAIREQMMGIQGGVTTEDLSANWDVLGTPLVERYIRRNGEPSPEVMTFFGAELARRDPAQLVKLAPELLAATSGESREDLEAQINLARAKSGDETESARANEWIDAQKSLKREINARSVTQLLQLADVAQQLKRPDATQWIDYAAALSAQLGANVDGAARGWSISLAHLGFEATTRIVENWKAPAEFALWTNVGPELANSGDVAGARRALARLQTLALAPEIAGEKSTVLPAYSIGPRRINDTRGSLARAISPTDGNAALELAAQITDSDARAQTLLGVADGALRANHADIAEKAVRAASQAAPRNAELLALSASLGAQIRPQLGAELSALAFKQTALTANARLDDSTPSVGRWAFYHASSDAALSRVLIESEWSWRLPVALAKKSDDVLWNPSALVELTRAMAAIDPQRAAEMQAAAAPVKVPYYRRNVSAFDVAIVALADDAARARWGLEAQRLTAR